MISHARLLAGPFYHNRCKCTWYARKQRCTADRASSLLLNDIPLTFRTVPLIGKGSLGKQRLHAIQRDDVSRCCIRAPCPPPFVIMAMHLTRSPFAPPLGKLRTPPIEYEATPDLPRIGQRLHPGQRNHA